MRRGSGRRCAGIGALVALTLSAGCQSGAHTRAGAARASATPAATAASQSASPPGQAGNPVAVENARQGTPDWRLTSPAPAGSLEGWADATSLLPGTPVRLFVSTLAPQFRVRVFRLGWYGGDRARLVQTSPWTLGRHQPPAVIVAPTHTAQAPWTSSLTLATDGWVSGDYLLQLDASNGWQSFVPLTVRTPTNAGLVVLLNAVTTWEAYNDWGGYSLYHGPGGGGDFTDRARAVSFDRPYAFDNGAADFLGNELPVISLAERLGLPLGYATDIDLHADPSVLRGARGVISMGHDEYWSTQMRAAVTAARDAGTNVAFLGANAVFRHIRLQPSPTGPDRVEVDYKRASEDPVTASDPAEATSDWREPPIPRPESTLTGALYECNPVSADLVIIAPQSWLFVGTGAVDGMHLHGLAGPEYDRVNPGGPVPRPMQVLSHSPLTCRGAASFTDSAYYTTPSGSGVFDVGTGSWVCAIDGVCPPGRSDEQARRVVTAATTNLLRDFSAGPLGRQFPAQDNVAALHEYAGDPTYHPRRG